MVATICFYILVGILGLFGLALIIASIASIVHNVRRGHRVKKYIKDNQSTKNLDKSCVQEKHVISSGHPIVITQTQDGNNAQVVIGYTPSYKTPHLNKTVQENTGNSAEKKTKSKSFRKPNNSRQVMSKYSRNNSKEDFTANKKLKKYNQKIYYNKHNIKTNKSFSRPK